MGEPDCEYWSDAPLSINRDCSQRCISLSPERNQVLPLPVEKRIDLQNRNSGTPMSLFVNSLQLEVGGVLVRCQKSRQDTKNTRRRCCVEVQRPSLGQGGLELCRTARRFPLKPRARLRMNGASLFARNPGVNRQSYASGLTLEALASKAVIDSAETKYGSYQEPQISQAVV